MKEKSVRRMICGIVPALLLLAVACNKKEAPPSAAAANESASTPVAARTAGSGDPIRDYKVPFLTDERMEKFLASLQEPKNPFEILFKAGGMMRSSQLKDKVADLNAYATRYGFKGYEEYMAVWGRITVAEISQVAVGMKKGVIEMITRMKNGNEEKLRNPNLTPEERKDLQEQVADNIKSLAEMQKPSDSGISEADMAVYLKYKEPIDQAVKKIRAGQGK
jgi:hypothetical protein